MFNLSGTDHPNPSTEVTVDYSSLAVDMHSHVLPGIDDGARTLRDSLVLIGKMMEAGIKKIIATPHIMADHYKNNFQTINNALNILKAELEKEKIEVGLEAAAEYYFDEVFLDLLNQKKLITLGDNFVLFEIPLISKPRNLIEVIEKMKGLDYKPILAHPERYLYLKLPDYRSIKACGCHIQLNTISLTGYYGKEIKKKAEELADGRLIDFISSDMHHAKHAGAFQDALKLPYVKSLLANNFLKNSLLV